MKSTFPIAVIVFTFAFAVSVRAAQDDDDRVSAATFVDTPPFEEQKRELNFVTVRFGVEIDELRHMKRFTDRHLRRRVFERETELEKFLPEEKIRALNEERKTQTIQCAKANFEFLPKFAGLIKAVYEADDVTIYEGLPRRSETELANIRNKHKTIKFEDFDFYAEPLPTQASIVELLRTTLIDYRHFKPYSGEKFCGGFHPDFCVEWKSGDNTFRLLICFMCDEMKFITPTEKIEFDLGDAAWSSFAQIAITTFKHHADDIKRLDQVIGR